MSLPADPQALKNDASPLCAVTRGPLTMTGSIPGIDEATGRAPPDPADQFALAYRNLALVLETAGLAPGAVTLLEVTIPERALRDHIDAGWLALFPDALARPARKTNQRPLPEGQLVQLDAVCMSGARRTLAIDGLAHRAPIPMGTAAGPYVFSSVIGGEDPASGRAAQDPEAQIRQAFANCVSLMESAGSGADAINHLWVFVPDAAHTDLMLGAFLDHFPDPASRPARKTIQTDLPAGCAIQLQPSGCTLGRSGNFEVEGFRHHDPIPLGSRAGQLLQSSGIHGLIPGRRTMAPGGTGRQADLALASVAGLMAEAGGSLADIAGLTVLQRNSSDAAVVEEAVRRAWNGRPLPAIRFAQVHLPPAMLVQFHVTAWLA